MVVALVFRKGQLDAFARPKYLVLAVCAVTLLSLCALSLWRSRVSLWFRTVPDTLVAVLLGWHLVAYVGSEVRSVSLHGEAFQFQGFATVLLYCAGYALVRLVPDRSSVPIGAAVAGALAASYGLLQYVDLDPLWDVLFKGRIFSTFGQPNALAAFLVMSLPFAFVLALQSHRSLRTIGRVATPAIAGALLLTMSRGGYVALVVAAVATLAIVARHVPTSWWLRVVGGAVLSLAVLAAVPATRTTLTDVGARATSIAGPLDSSNDKRVDLWVVAVAMTNDHPWFGTGHEVYPQFFDEYADQELDAKSRAILAPFRPESPHNGYLATAVNAGWPALVFYAAVIGWALIEAGRRFRATLHPLAGAVFFALVAHVVTDFFMTAETATSWLFWLLIDWLASTGAPRRRFSAPRSGDSTTPNATTTSATSREGSHGA